MNFSSDVACTSACSLMQKGDPQGLWFKDTDKIAWAPVTLDRYFNDRTQYCSSTVVRC